MKKNLLFFALMFVYFSYGQDKSANDLFTEASKEITANNYDYAIGLLKESTALARETGDKRILSKSLTALGEAYTKTGNDTEAVKTYLNALSELKKSKDNLEAAQVCKALGKLYFLQGKPDVSLNYYNEGTLAAKQLNNEILTADCLSGAGPAYEELHKIDKALEVYSQALAIYRARGMDLVAGETLSSMGNAYKKQGDYPQSVLNYKEALGNFHLANDSKKVADVLCSLGGVVAMMEDHNESLRLFEQAYLDAVAIQYDEVIIKASLGMATAYENLRQYPESVRYHKIYEQKKESFDSKKRAEELALLKEKYAGQKGNSVAVEGSGKSLASASSSGIDYALLAGIGGGIIVFLLVLGFLWRRKMLKKNNEDTMFNDAEGQERLRLVQNIHNDLDSKLTKINSLSESIIGTTGLPTIRSQGEAMQEATKKIEEDIRDLVWLLTPKNTTLTNYVGSIKEYVQEYFEGTDVELIISQPEGISNTVISKESQLGLLSVIKESLVFVKEDSNVSKVFFGITYTGTRLMVSVKDNGKGVDISDSDKKRLDGHLHSTGGIMRMDCDPGWGTTVKIIIPVEKSAKGKKSAILNFYNF